MRIEKKGQVFSQVGLLVAVELCREGGDKGSALGKCFTGAITMIHSFLSDFHISYSVLALRGCLYGDGLALFAKISISVKLFVKIYFHLYERRASPPWRDLDIDYPRSRLGGLEIFHINAQEGWPS